MILAKRTVYRGVLFRSKLEAKWASVFDHFSLKWHYEPRPFFRKDGSFYTPDFMLGTWPRTFVEIKPGPSMCLGENINAVTRTGAPFLILDTPSPMCFGYPYYLDDEWTDICWCMSKDELQLKHENRFYTHIGAYHENETRSVKCPNCDGDIEGWEEPYFRYPQNIIPFRPHRQVPYDKN